ncbi:MAG: acyltransferase domain-containing protein, partial [Pseudonocardia sp.]|nr:acyltransferase domain-containing protein [Pseudonocardia sp.]
HAGSPVDEPDGVVAWQLSARTAEGLADQALRLADHLADHPARSADVARALTSTRSRFAHRATLVGDRTDLDAQLRALGTGAPHPATVVGETGAPRRTVFVFPGQGGQWAGMGAELLATTPVFAAAVARCDAALRPHVDWSVTDLLAGAADSPSLARVDVVQPALWAMMVGLAEVWRACGIEPDAVVGHSQGEIAAACVAGALSLEDGALVAARDPDQGRGRMASLPLSADDTHAALAEAGGDVGIAALNGPRTTVVSGDAHAVAGLVAGLVARGVDARLVDVDYASHSAHVDALTEELTAALAPVAPGPSRVPFYSAVHAAAVGGETLDGAYWIENLRRPVRFADTVTRLLDDGLTRFVEPSPHAVLAVGIDSAAAGHPRAAEVTVTPTLRRDAAARVRLLTALAGVHADVDLTPVLPGGRPVPLPTYPFRRRRYWITAPTATTRASGHALLPQLRRPAPDGTLILTGRLASRDISWLADHVVDGRVLVPGVAMLDAAVHAAGLVGCAEIDELTLLVPLEVPADGAVDVQLTVGAPDGEQARELSLHARVGEDGRWTLHATGRAVPGAGSWPGPGPQALPGTGESRDPDALYAGLADAGYGYGPTFRGVRALEGEAGGVLATVALDADTDPSGHAVHPALLDACLHPLLPPDPDTGAGPRLPFTFSGVRVLATGARAGVARLVSAPVSAPGETSGDTFGVTLWDP